MNRNLFDKALSNAEIFDFITGTGEYYVPDREVGEHWPLGSYNNYIGPYFKGKAIDCFEDTFWQQVNKELEVSTDINSFLDHLVGYLIPYYYQENVELKLKRVLSTPQSFIESFKTAFVKYGDQLKSDKRGVGAEWNSVNKGMGMYGGILANLESIKKRGGIDLVPEECQGFV